MACVENMEPPNADSEMEEGEIVDDVDYLSDISSEEEFLLRQRLQVLENYNNVLERKKAKNSFGSGLRKQDALLQDLSEFSASDLEDNIAAVKSKPTVIVYKNKNDKEQKHLKSHKHKKRKVEQKTKEKKKVHYRKRLEVKVIDESSEESEDEYRNKRRKLANAVSFHRDTNDKTSLQERLNKMLCKSKTPEINKSIVTITENKQSEIPEFNINVPVVTKSSNVPTVTIEVQSAEDKSLPENAPELIDLSSDEDIIAKVDENIASDKQSIDVVDAETKDNCNNECKQDLKADSDEDLELLRQHALKTKSSKAKVDLLDKTVSALSPKPTSEDEDSDTAELRMICLKSALLKKAIEMKQKQKLQKRLSQSSNLKDDFLLERDELLDKIQSENNTDIESVDMDIGSDGEDKGKEVSSENAKVTTKQDVVCDHNENIEINTQKPNSRKEDELEEDEDLLRAKLLTSLSKNLPHLVDPSALNTDDDEIGKKEKEVAKEKAPSVPKIKIPENRIVINLGESDSDGEEHEATKNLTKMHMKLSEQVDFQEKLDIFLKSTRMEVEKSKLPDVVQEPLTPRTKEKFVAKSLNHLPKTEQIEYRNLVKRMAELEKIKQARQTSMNLVNQAPIKDTLKPRNVTVDPAKFVTINQIEEQIALSRKKIAEESAIMLKLKEQATKLSQKYKIVATELKNIATAITLNKKEQRSAQNRLSKIRIQHQRLLNSSTAKHSKTNGNLAVHNPTNKDLVTTKLQKENNPKNDEYKNSAILKALKVSVANQGDSVSNNARLSVQVDVVNNKKTVKLPNEKSSTRVVEIQKDINVVNNNINNQNDSVPNTEKLSAKNVVNNDKKSVQLPKEKSSTRVVEIQKDLNKKDKLDDLKEGDTSIPVVEKGGGKKGETFSSSRTPRKKLEDYKSPLEALDNANWEADPNAILCPFEVGGNCKDSDCKFLHPKLPN